MYPGIHRIPVGKAAIICPDGFKIYFPSGLIMFPAAPGITAGSVPIICPAGFKTYLPSGLIVLPTTLGWPVTTLTGTYAE